MLALIESAARDGADLFQPWQAAQGCSPGVYLSLYVPQVSLPSRPLQNPPVEMDFCYPITALPWVIVSLKLLGDSSFIPLFLGIHLEFFNLSTIEIWGQIILL